MLNCSLIQHELQDNLVQITNKSVNRNSLNGFRRELVVGEASKLCFSLLTILVIFLVLTSAWKHCLLPSLQSLEASPTTTEQVRVQKLSGPPTAHSDDERKEQ